MSIRAAVENFKADDSAARNDADRAREQKELDTLRAAFLELFEPYGATLDQTTWEIVPADGQNEYTSHAQLHWDGYSFQFRCVDDASYSGKSCLCLAQPCGKCGRSTLFPLRTPSADGTWPKSLPWQIAEAEKYATAGNISHGGRRRGSGCVRPSHEHRFRCSLCGKGPEEL